MELVCPGCRTWTPERIDVRLLEPSGEVLACTCGRRYPVVDGVPIVMADPSEYLRSHAVGVVERDLPPEVAALLAAGGDDAPYAHLLEHLSIYLDSHWGDRAEPPPDGPGAGLGLSAVIERLAALPRVERAVELGCSTGRIVAELRAEQAVGVELELAAARRARRLLAGESLAYCRRMAGRHYITAQIAGIAAVGVTIVCGDALDPPLVPRAYDRVVALNLLDSVASPRQLLAVADGLLGRGGELILSSPYTWQSGVMADAERIGGADPAAALRAILTGGEGLEARYEIQDSAELPWSLRRDARSALTYRVDYLRARKS